MTSVPLGSMLERTVPRSCLGILLNSLLLTYHLPFIVENVSAAATTQLPPILNTLQTNIQKAVIIKNYNEHCFVKSGSNTLLHFRKDDLVPLTCPAGYRRQADEEQCHGRYGCCICEHGTYQPYDNHCYHCILKTFCPDYGLVFEDYGSLTNNSRCGERMTVTEKELHTPHDFPESEVFTTSATAPFIQSKGTEGTHSSSNESFITDSTADPQTFNPRDISDTGILCGSLHKPVWVIIIFMSLITLIFVAIANCLPCSLCCCRVTCYSTLLQGFPQFCARKPQEKTYNYSSVGNTNIVMDSTSC